MAMALRKIKSPTLINEIGGRYAVLSDLPDDLADTVSAMAQKHGIQAAKNFLLRTAWAKNHLELDFNRFQDDR